MRSFSAGGAFLTDARHKECVARKNTALLGFGKPHNDVFSGLLPNHELERLARVLESLGVGENHDIQNVSRIISSST